MTDVNRLVLEDESGTAYTMYFEADDAIDTPSQTSDDDEYEAMGVSTEVQAKLADIHGTLKSYANYALGAFKGVAGAEVEEITLKFGIKIAGSTGLPVLAQGSAEGSFEIEVKCKPK
ncbi:CU044_2847 family protein [Adonisia turfae]|uniref:Trypsin-co-occurring domain-containing protein n=1 Tax=Adonisia turfae CCMR0081 TaxID=2292702 RepID=A0A6M0RFD2_9CYAN|nr:CU044_2847 family protein [Adonisia turfae]NEZ54583.1 hypothetical protein [Adonisia turfae CCMR0081]